MTRAEHKAQRDLVLASLRADDLRAAIHGIYPRRQPRTRTVPPRAPQTRSAR